MEKLEQEIKEDIRKVRIALALLFVSGSIIIALAIKGLITILK